MISSQLLSQYVIVIKELTGCVSVSAAWAAGEKLSADPADLQKPQSRK